VNRSLHVPHSYCFGRQAGGLEQNGPTEQAASKRPGIETLNQMDKKSPRNFDRVIESTYRLHIGNCSNLYAIVLNPVRQALIRQKLVTDDD
jgi:hypothetical protein